jgi:hypothetical protein
MFRSTRPSFRGLCLVKIRSAFKINNIQRGRVACYMDEIRLTWSFGEGQGFEPVALPNFSFMAAITFVDMVVSHGPYDNRTLFHELVHVVQYEKLGVAEFAAKYVRGFLNGGSYEAIPLEVNAYGLDARFAGEPAKPFSVETEVRAWIYGGRL